MLCICIWIWICMCMCLCVCVYIYICICIYVDVHVHGNACAYDCVHVYVHIRVYAYVCTRMHCQARAFLRHISRKYQTKYIRPHTPCWWSYCSASSWEVRALRALVPWECVCEHTTAFKPWYEFIYTCSIRSICMRARNIRVCAYVCVCVRVPRYMSACVCAMN